MRADSNPTPIASATIADTTAATTDATSIGRGTFELHISITTTSAVNNATNITTTTSDIR